MSLRQKLNPRGKVVAWFMTFIKKVVMAALSFTAKEYTASGAIDLDLTSFVDLNDASSALAMTIAAPEAGKFLVIRQKDAGTQGHTVTLTAGTWDGATTVATFNAQDETLVLFGVSATRFIIVENAGAVALS